MARWVSVSETEQPKQVDPSSDDTEEPSITVAAVVLNWSPAPFSNTHTFFAELEPGQGAPMARGH